MILVSYGDMLRVPGSRSDLFRARALGGDVRIAYSPTEAVKIAPIAALHRGSFAYRPYSPYG